MQQYAMLIKLTSQGAERHVGDLAERVRELQRAMETLRGSMKAIITLGEYDVVATGEVEKTEDLAFLAALAVADGNASIETLVGYTVDEWADVQARPFEDEGRPFKT